MPDRNVLPKTYDPTLTEPEIGRFWEQGGYFHAEPDARDASQPYCIVIPPPNVTGALHLGHAINNTLQDILIRWRRMRGHNALWMPGTDHAGIATQAVVERRLKEEENKDRHTIGREALVKRIWEWKDEYQARILSQLKRIGCSCDWARTRFTLDEVCAKAVRHTFFKMFRDGLIYRGKRLVNWDTALQTAVADDEVYHETVQGHLWHMRYPLADGSGTLTVATTRPETMLGDTAVAVHPNDERYKHLIGRTCKLPLTDREIPVIADGILVKKEFGSGCVKVTPAHDPNDYACGQRNGLEMINILTPDGKINVNGGRFEGMDRYVARKEVVAALKAEGLLEKIEDYETDIGHSDRSKTPIEPYLSEQWFLKMDDLSGDGADKIEGLRGAPGLAQLAMDAVTSGRVKVHPERYAKSYLDWLGEKRDWCISRQLWWGHQIPIWYCTDCSEPELREALAGRDGIAWRRDESQDRWLICSEDEELPIRALARHKLIRDPDVLDTWFSSALWPHSTLGWPDDNPALSYYYPTSLLCTSRDIITLWVARMVLTGLYNMGEVPFGDVYIHVKILDGRGETMSKSKGNGVDPVDIIEAFGADALRFGMAAITTETQDVRLPVEYRCPHCKHLTPQTRENMTATQWKCEGCSKAFATQWADAETAEKLGRALCVSDKFEAGRNFCNKLFQAARFAFMNLEGVDAKSLDVASLPIEDRWILSQTSRIAATVGKGLADYQFARTLNLLRDYFWGDLCDWYLELIKSRIRDDNRAAEAKQVLAFCLDVTLRLLHPVVPFITERLWRTLNEIAPERGLPDTAELNIGEALTVSSFPPADGWPALTDPDVTAVFTDLCDATQGVRNVRVTRGLPPRQQVEVTIKAPAERTASLEHEAHIVERLANVSKLTIDSDAKRPPNAATVVSGELQIYVHDVIDDAAERSRLQKELADLDKQIDGKQRKLGNENFTARAPADVVQRERDRLVELQGKREALIAALSELGA